MTKRARRLQEAQRLHAQGNPSAAVKAYAGLRREAPNDAIVLHGLGVALAQLGRLEEADEPLTQAATLMPRNLDIAFDLGVLRDAQGKIDEAEAAFRRVVELDPHHARAWAALGLVKRDGGDLPGSSAAYRHASEERPQELDLVLNAAESMAPGAGADFLVAALHRFPREERILLPLADLSIRANRMEEAEATLQTVRSLTPRNPLALQRLGMVQLSLQRFPEAAGTLYAAIALDPNDADTWLLLSEVRDRLGDPDGAAAAAERAVRLDPQPDTIGLRARLHQHANRVETAQAGLHALPSIVRETAQVRLLQGMLLPPIVDSNAHIDALRERWMETMADVEASPGPEKVEEPWNSIGLTGNYLGYHGRTDRPLMEAYSRATLASSPHLAYESKNPGSGTDRIRVGFLSAHMRSHSVGRVLIDLMGALDRSRFETILFQLPDKRGGGQERGEAAADRVVPLVPRLDQARAAVEAERPDILIFCDLHLNPFSDALTHSRLAPVQATTWGHPGTGGRSTLDYWISYKHWEVEDGQRFYTEKLVPLDEPPLVTPRFEWPNPLPGRTGLGLPEGVPLYGLLQSLFKIHPDFDSMLAEILEGDPKARIVAIAGMHYTWQERLDARFSRSFDPSRIIYLPKLRHPDYLAAVDAVDVVLDPIHFGGANTSTDAFNIGKPVVTLPGEQMRNRPTYGYYLQMGFTDLVADTPKQYVELAHRVAQDRPFAREARERILASNGVLFDNLEPVKAFEAWLESVRK